MKVKVMGAGVVILTILAGGQYYTQASYRDRLHQQIDKLNTLYTPQGISVTAKSAAHSWLGATDKFAVDLAPGHPLSQVLGQSSGLHILVDNTCQFWPFYVSCENTLHANDEATANLADTFDIQYTMGWSANMLVNSLNSHLATQSFIIDQYDGTLTVNPLSIQTDSDLATSFIDLLVDWQGISLTGSSSGTNIDMGKSVIEAELTKIEGEYFVSESDITLDSLTITSQDMGVMSGTITLNALSAASELEAETADTYELEQTFSISKITAAPSDIVVEDLTFDLALDGLTKRFLAKAKASDDTLTDQQLLNAALDEFGAVTHNLDFEKIGFKYNQQPVLFTAALTIDKHSSADINQGKLGNKISGKANLSVAQALVKENPVAAMLIQEKLKQGVVTLNEGTYNMPLTLQNGVMKANGKAIYQL